MSKSPEQKIYEFDEFRFDAEHLMLYRRDEALPLAPKAAETLRAFIEHRGEILRKDELIELIWPDSFVEESNLFLYLSTLRRTLGVQENGEPYLETLRRRGYRFSADVRVVTGENGANGKHATALVRTGEADPRGPVEIIDDTPPPPSVIPDPPQPPARKWHRLAYAVGGLFSLMAVVGFGYWYVDTRQAIDSIAVMPFVNETGNSEIEYLADGMTDILIGSLRKIPELQVKASSTMSRYKGTNMDPATVGRDLGVKAVLASRMTQRGDDVTLIVELVDSESENSLWHQTYNRKMSQMGVMQRSVAQDLVRELSIKVTDPVRRKVADSYTESAEAAQLYLRGVFLIRQLNEPQIREGLVNLRRATQHDPSYAPAFAMIASGLRSLTLCCDVEPSELEEGKTAATRAIELDPNSAEAHSALASYLFLVDWNFAEAEKHYLRALDLDPNSAISHFLYADFLGRMDRRAEASVHRTRAVELEPYSPYFNAFALYTADPATALQKARFAIDLDPNFYFSHFMAAGVYQRMNMFSEAVAAYRRAKELAPEQTWTDISHSGLLQRLGEIEQARAVQDDLLHRSQSRYVPPFHIAIVYNQRGDTDQALAWLEKAYQARDPKMTFLKTGPGWKKLEADPRFQEIYKRIGFP